MGKCTVQEMAMPTILHLHYDVLARRGTAEKVIGDALVVNILRKVLLVQKRQVFNVMLTCQQFVKQDYQQILAGGLAEDYLEAEIRERVTKRDDIIKMILWFLTAKKRILSGNSYE